MGIFDVFKKDADNKEQSKINPILEIASIISNKDKDVIDKLSDCVSKPQIYFEENIHLYQNRGFTEMSEISTIKWIALVEILQAHDYVCERDFKDELEDFVYFINQLNQVKKGNLFLKEEYFQEDDDISGWCEIIDDNWYDKNMCIACIDIDSDSYVLFVCSIEKLDRLKNIANKINQRIDFAKNM